MEAAGGRFGSVLGQAGLTRFDRDVLAQSGVKYVIVGLGIYDIAVPGSLTPATEGIKAESIIAGNQGHTQIGAEASITSAYGAVQVTFGQ